MIEVTVPADPVKLTRSWLAPHLPGVTVTKNRPNPLTGKTVLVRRSGGLRPLMVVDAAWLSVECYAPSDDEASQLASHVWGLLFAMRGQVIDGVQCYRVEAIAGPADMPLTDPGEQQRPRFTFAVQASFRMATKS